MNYQENIKRSCSPGLEITLRQKLVQRVPDFDEKASTWELDFQRINLANDVANMIINEIKPTPDMDALDYGCGTGLVTLRIHPLVKSIIGVDSSSAMLRILKEKVKKQELKNVRAKLMDFELGDEIKKMFHLIISSMALHHIEDPAILVKQFYNMLYYQGYLAIADLDKEDGSFHEDDDGVFHYGFECKYLKTLFENSNFREVRYYTASKIVKKRRGKRKRTYSVFLIIGRKC